MKAKNNSSGYVLHYRLHPATLSLFSCHFWEEPLQGAKISEPRPLGSGQNAAGGNRIAELRLSGSGFSDGSPLAYARGSEFFNRFLPPRRRIFSQVLTAAARTFPLLAALVLIFGRSALLSLAADSVVGNVTVIESDATILQPGELFDLNNRTVTFTPKSGGGYTTGVGALSFDSRTGTDLNLADDNSSLQALNFTFPFFGVNRTSVFVNANGHVTFGGSSALSHFNSGGSPASLGTDVSTILDRIASQLPRIAPLWQDWDPSAGGGVFANSLSDRLIVTWNSVPLFGTTTTATFQVVLFSTGAIQMSYSSVPTTPAGGYLTGISPGGRNEFQVTTVDFSLGPASSISTFPNFEPLAQVFGSSTSPLVHINAVARKLYGIHPDRFDQIVMFANFTHAMGDAFAFELTTRQTTSGIGLPLFNGSSFFGSAGKLQSFLNMNRLSRYPADPAAVFLGTDSTLSIMGQESGHQWLAFVNFDNGGVCSDLLLGRDLAHWSFFHDSDASDMEGNKWRDNGNGTFTTIEATTRFSALDQYIMGLRSAAEVSPFFFIDGPTGTTKTRSSSPQLGVTASGLRKNVTLSNVITCEGSRSPSSGFSTVNSTTVWNQAFILLIGAGATAPSADLAKIDNIRTTWTSYFPAATTGRGAVSTALGTPTLSGVSASPFVISPNSDNINDLLAIQFTLSAPDTITIEILDRNGAVVATPMIASSMNAGTTIVGWNGFDSSGAVANDGMYTFRVRGTGGTATGSFGVNNTVPEISKSWLLAEGSTVGFEAYALVHNPNNAPVTVTLTFFKQDGTTQTYSEVVPALTRTTVPIHREVPGTFSVSTRVDATLPILVERAMYFNSSRGGHDSIGVTSTAQSWFFPANRSLAGDEDFILIVNPSSSSTAAVTATFFFENQNPLTQTYSVGPNSRFTIPVHGVVQGTRVSVRLQATVAIAAERALYINNRAGGAAGIGAVSPSLTWYFAEGDISDLTSPFVATTLLELFNPANAIANVTVNYLLENGTVIAKSYTLAAERRRTINAASDVGVGQRFSLEVLSNTPVVAERLMFSGADVGDSIGSPTTAYVWNLAEGFTAFGYETWVIVSNPGSQTANLTARFLKQNGQNIVRTYTLPAKQRLAIYVNTAIDEPTSVSTRVTSDQPIVVERTMKFAGRMGMHQAMGVRQ
ncbi:MAG: gliding motility-associated C-terminal domain-containing protein [Acidobacteria bacterium]|nr:gliding motility-associated C-terminal domain-containing protein [Acidobacteriota bacterium]